MAILITILYSISLLYIFLFSLGQLHLTWLYVKIKRYKSDSSGSAQVFSPKVTIQLPVFNERYVVERLIEAVSKLKHPKDSLEIQILDDSTDDTTAIILKKVESLRLLKLDINLIHRENRSGFKAGALDHALKLAKGEFIAIFDADFIPDPDFLKNTLHIFSDPSIGAVQTRWDHINKDYSILTKLQAFGLDAHFSVEQGARNNAGSFINFNGTCGIWRKACIEDAGGWSSDTLTEDLDLSYRAQLKNWKFKYLEEISTPGELPVIMPAIKAQQYRWNKGAAETARKVFGKVVHSDIAGINKVHAFFHLFNSSVFLSLLLAAILSVPMLFIRRDHPELNWVFILGNIFLLGFMSITIFYWVATKRFNENASRTFFNLFPGFLVVSMGLSLHNGIAVIEGLLGIRTPFVRTPKFNIRRKGESWKNNVYVHPKLNAITLFEGLLCLYFIGGIVIGFYLQVNILILFHVMLAIGFGCVFYYSVKPLTNA
jgi:cellulose synthase/poly-beta-1,6-N-acetylglucosamine synthase-like glycosyltransferase